MQSQLIQFAVALLVGLALSGPVAVACRRAGWVDPPGGHKGHGRAVPFGGFLYVMPVWWLLWAQSPREGAGPALFWIGGAFLLVGLVEDLLKARHREIPWLLRLILLAAPLALVRPFGASAGAGWQAPTALLLLLAGAIAWNWLDHADGLAAGAGLGALLGLSVRSLADDGLEHWAPGSQAGIAMGLLAAFLLVNGVRRGGARLYLGDAGAQLLGYSVVALALVAPREGGPGPPDLAAALLVAAVPLADALRVTVQRLASGLPPWRPDRERHLAHLPFLRRLPRGVLPAAVAGVAFLLAWAGLRLGW